MLNLQDVLMDRQGDILPPPPQKKIKKKKKKKKKCLQGIIIMGRGRSCNRWMSVSSGLESYQGLIKVVS